MNEKMGARAVLMRQIYESEFMIIELGLFLDTHSGCIEALEAFKGFRDAYNRYVEEYNREYGPLTFHQVDSDNYWTWVQSPWPWEMEGC